jgi:hypothetical protein
MSCRIASLLFLALPGLAVCADKITYDDHIFPIFESKCLNCHNPDKKKGDLDLSTYTGTMAGSSGGKIALAGDGASSKLYTVTVHTEEPVMPPEGDKITKKDADLIRAWIDGGLLENKGSKAKKREKPAFTLAAVPTGGRPEGPPPMPEDLLLEPVITPSRATVVADMQASPWAPLLAVTAPRQVLLYHTDTLELVGILPFPKGNPETLSFHPSGKYLLAGGGVGGKSGTTVTWDIVTGEVLMTMGREFDAVLAADLRADLGGVAMGGPSRLIKLWDPTVDEQIKSIKKHTDWVTALAYSPDGVLLATGDRNNGVQVWEAATGNEFHSLRGHQKAITDLKWRADSNLLASASEDGSIRFWDMNRGKEIKRGNAGPGVLALDYARNGKLISAGRDKRIKVWKADLTVERQSPPFAELVTEVAFSHDGARYFTADWNGKIEAWNTADLKKVGELEASPPSIATRLSSLSKEKEAFLKTVDELKAQNEAAQKAHQESLAAIANVETAIVALKNEVASLGTSDQKYANEIRQFEQEAKALLEQHRELIAKKDEALKQKAAGLVTLENKKKAIPVRQQEIPALRKSSQEKATAAATAKGAFDAAVAKLPALDLKMKKWRAAAINIKLHEARKELAKKRAEAEAKAEEAKAFEKSVQELEKQYRETK